MSADPLAPPYSIVQVCSPAEVGGLERVVQGLCMSLSGRDHLVTLVAVVEEQAHADALFEPLLSSPVRTEAFVLPGRAYVQERRMMKRLLAELRPDVLHTHGYRPDLLHGGAARRAGIATVSTLHGSSRMGGLSRVFEWVQERALARFDAVVAVSPPLVDSLVDVGVDRRRIHAVPNAWSPLEVALPRDEARARLGVSEEGTFSMGWVGRLIPIKGADVFVRALAELPADPAWVAFIVGDGPERVGLEELARDLGIADRVRFVGSVASAGRLFPGFDLFVMSSRSEGTPMVLLEAMGASLPIVVTSVGGVPDVVEAGDEAWIVPKESPSELAEAIGSAIADPDERARRAERANARLKRDFSEEQWARSHEEAYASALRNRRGVAT